MRRAWSDVHHGWVCIDIGASARHSDAEVDAVRSAVATASFKVSLFAKVSRDEAAMEIKISKTKAMLLGSMVTGCVREAHCVNIKPTFTDYECPDFKRGFPNYSGLAHHA